MNSVRLAPGVALVTVPGRGLAVRTPGGEFLKVATGEVRETDLRRRLHAPDGTPDGPAAASADGDGPSGGTDRALDALVAAFEGAGYATREPLGTGMLTGYQVLLLGDPVLVDPLMRCARDEGAEVGTITPDRLPRTARRSGGSGRTVVVWCLDGPVPPGLWDEADRLPGHSVAWLRCHREGDTAWLEPLAATTDDVTSAHVRLRRLAATAAHHELGAYWASLSAEGPGSGHSTASAALTAGLLMEDLVAWASGDRSARRRLRRVRVRGLTVSRHPVLPVPEVAPYPASALPVPTDPASAEPPRNAAAPAMPTAPESGTSGSVPPESGTARSFPPESGTAVLPLRESGTPAPASAASESDRPAPASIAPESDRPVPAVPAPAPASTTPTSASTVTGPPRSRTAVPPPRTAGRAPR
ncbi:hypothetical protein ACIBCB_23580 [Streptomyces uncialis]|uniref:hypothetical protein n=1 Tax=Streptomyces uncialis TaxID=1048205 RepID=UPI0037896541